MSDVFHRIEAAPDGRVVGDVWGLPLEEEFLQRLLTELFEEHHESLIFGPIIQGGAYELRAPGKPEKITHLDGYLTIHWGQRGHFHLCIGENKGSPNNPTPPELRAHRRPSRAEFYRGRDKNSDPVTWSFRMFNGKDEPQITIFFPNPFLTDADAIASVPDWSRLALWEDILRRYASQEPDGLDRQGKGFVHA
jgi:hypothetical protein